MTNPQLKAVIESHTELLRQYRLLLFRLVDNGALAKEDVCLDSTCLAPGTQHIFVPHLAGDEYGHGRGRVQT